MNREQELLNKCITYIWEHVENYYDMIDTFKKLGFTEKELVDYDLRDYYVEEQLNIINNKGGDK